MTKKQKKMLLRIIISFVLLAALMLCEHFGVLPENIWVQLVLFAVPYLIIGYDIIGKAARNIRHGQVFDENFLMMLATFGAFGARDFSEAAAVMLFYQVGELFQSYAVGKSRQSIADMMDICPEYANIEENGTLTQVDPDDVEGGSVIVIKPGERVPLDGIVIEGESLIDTAALTGESVPRRTAAGEEIISGCVNGSGTLKVRTCALVISVPLGFFGGIGAASRIGVLVKGGNYLEAVAEMTTIVFDKTGTLTKGEFKVTGLYPENGFTAASLLELAAHAEGYSNHPIAESVRAAYLEQSGNEIDISRVEDAAEQAGHGICVAVDGRNVLIGNEKLMKANGIQTDNTSVMESGTVCYVACDNVYAGAVVISDTVKEGAREALADMKTVGVKKCVMLTGDRTEAAEAVARELGIDEVHAQLLPADKVTRVEALLSSCGKNERLAFAGDGINDAPVLARADIGFAMGSMGSDAAIEAADVVLMDDDVRKIAAVVRIARKTLRIVKQNIVFALAVKALVLLLGALGMASMWEAVFADVGVAVIAILNSMRTLKTCAGQAACGVYSARGRH